jgi:hypothetical protein
VTVSYLDRMKHLRSQLRRLTTELEMRAADETVASPQRAEARAAIDDLTLAAHHVSCAMDDAFKARDAAYTLAAATRKRPTARAHPWRSRAVVPPRPKGVE